MDVLVPEYPLEKGLRTLALEALADLNCQVTTQRSKYLKENYERNMEGVQEAVVEVFGEGREVTTRWMGPEGQAYIEVDHDLKFRVVQNDFYNQGCLFTYVLECPECHECIETIHTSNLAELGQILSVGTEHHTFRGHMRAEHSEETASPESLVGSEPQVTSWYAQMFKFVAAAIEETETNEASEAYNELRP